MPVAIIMPEIRTNDLSFINQLAKAIHKKGIRPQIISQTPRATENARQLAESISKLGTYAEIDDTKIPLDIYEMTSHLGGYAIGSQINQTKTNGLVLITSKELADIFPSFFSGGVLEPIKRGVRVGVKPLGIGEAAYFEYALGWVSQKLENRGTSIIP